MILLKNTKIIMLYFLMILLVLPACSNQSLLSPSDDDPNGSISINNRSSSNLSDNTSNDSLSVVDGKWVEQKVDIISKPPDFDVSNSYCGLSISEYEVIAEKKNAPLVWAMGKWRYY